MTHGIQDEMLRKSGQLICELRNQAGMTQEDLAFESGIDQSKISQIERLGPQVVSWRKFLSLVEALNCLAEVTLVQKEEQ